MPWSDEEWGGFCQLLDGGWPGDLTEDTAAAMRFLLDAVEPAAAAGALRGLLRTSRFRPTAADIVQAVERDARRPTFDEAYKVIFARRGSPLRHRDQRKAVAAAMEHHPLIARFIQVQGRDRLAYLEVDDPDYGGAKRKQLRDAWDAMVDAVSERDVAALVAGDRGAGQLARLDPLKALGSASPELDAGPS